MPDRVLIGFSGASFLVPCPNPINLPWFTSRFGDHFFSLNGERERDKGEKPRQAAAALADRARGVRW